MAEAITTAGRSEVKSEVPTSRRDMVGLIRATLRKTDSTDDEMDDALEALIELAKD